MLRYRVGRRFGSGAIMHAAELEPAAMKENPHHTQKKT
jgi:hypothetical protein